MLIIVVIKRVNLLAPCKCVFESVWIFMSNVIYNKVIRYLTGDKIRNSFDLEVDRQGCKRVKNTPFINYYEQKGLLKDCWPIYY